MGPGGIELDFSGPFSLRAAAGFGFGPNVGRQAPSLRLAFPVDGESEDGYAGVLLHQEADDAPVRAEIDLGHPDTDPEIVVRQVRRIIGPSSRGYFQEFEHELPGLDVLGPINGTHNPFIGPAIRFEPSAAPRHVPGQG
ncbi:MAG: hypothetical protein QOD61_583 [Solirubrobacteraceae bacterium]|nr:hypothetical protein [Solirubrobacteraceae bacterium]